MNACKAAFVYSDDFLAYSFHENHPFNQKRILLTKKLLENHHALTIDQVITPPVAEEEDILSIHSPEYIHAVKHASKLEPVANQEIYGIGTTDTPMFQNMYDAARRIVGGSIEAANLVLTNQVDHALNLAGGLHHGFPTHASGFCILNDIAITIQYIRQHYHLKVLYIDIDAHHGDGVQHCFYDDPNVCTVSFHETGRYLYPGTGKISERGIKKGFGYNFNFPLDAFTEDDSYLHTFNESIDKIASYFQPDIIVSQHGTDTHYLDPLTHMHTTMKIYETIPKKIHQLAQQYCGGKWVALGGGGYDIWRVVPRAWAQLWNIMQTNTSFSGAISSDWIEEWQKESPVTLPTTWHDSLENYKAIPRRKEISEFNRQVLEQVLKFVENAKN